MPGQRAKNQKLVNLQMKEEFIREIDGAMPLGGYSHRERARFIRDAVYEKLERLGLKLPREIAIAPGKQMSHGETFDRTYKQKPLGGWKMNEAGVNLEEDIRDAKASTALAERILGDPPSKGRRKGKVVAPKSNKRSPSGGAS